MNTPFRALALGLALFALSACGGGGDNASDPSLLSTASGRAGSFSSASNNGYAVVEHLVYTNATDQPVTVRLTVAGQVRSDGVCDCYGSNFIAVAPFAGGTFTDSSNVRAPAAWTDASSSFTFTVPAGSTFSAETRVGYSAQTGASAAHWSDFAMTLRKL